jgi:hypothetical protein
MNIRAAIVALSIGASIGSAYADSSGGTIPNTSFTQLPGVSPTLPAPNAAAATAQAGTHAYVTQSGHGTWLFPPHQGGNG